MKIFLCPMPEKDDDYLGKLKIYIDNGSNKFVGIEDLSKTYSNYSESMPHHLIL